MVDVRSKSQRLHSSNASGGVPTNDQNYPRVELCICYELTPKASSSICQRRQAQGEGSENKISQDQHRNTSTRTALMTRNISSSSLPAPFESISSGSTPQLSDLQNIECAFVDQNAKEAELICGHEISFLTPNTKFST